MVATGGLGWIGWGCVGAGAFAAAAAVGSGQYAVVAVESVGADAAVSAVTTDPPQREPSDAAAVAAIGVAGGVSANTRLREELRQHGDAREMPTFVPSLQLSTDNAAMIAWAGIERFRAGARDDFALAARPRWPLDQTAAPMIGSGKKGAKA